MMIAQVVVDISTSSLDKPFDYLVPVNMEREMAVGLTVLVPFSKKNRLGMVVGLYRAEGVNMKLLEISDIVDHDPIFDDRMVELCSLISRRYIAPLSDCLRLAYPPGRKIKLIKRVELAEDADHSILTDLEREAFLLLAKAVYEGGRIENLLDSLDEGVLTVLKKRGFLKVVQVLVKPKSPVKMVELVDISISVEEARILSKELERSSPKQERILSILSKKGRLATKILLDEAKTSRSTLSALSKKGLINMTKVIRRPDLDLTFPEEVITHDSLTEEQSTAIASVKNSLAAGTFAVKLLYGVTASGKTEIYLRATEEALRRGKSVIILVPEISLTPQIAHRFQTRFKGEVAILHSALSDAERFDQWEMIKNGNHRIVLGARSALFAPLKDVGLIIVDEEHEPAYKQNSTPRYHGVWVAEQRAQLSGALLILGSATPSIESRFRAEKGEFELLRLTKRVLDHPLPKVEIVDLRNTGEDNRGIILSLELIDAARAALEEDKKVILFLNRRGYFGFILCKSCGYVFKCKNCEVSMVYHQKNRLLMCHHCGFRTRPKDTCPDCGGSRMGFYSFGTERVEEEIKRFFAGVEIVRMDRDTTRSRGAHRDRLIKFKESKGAILLGTQMIAKGLDFPDVALVGVINADTSLHLPDFRSEERTFQLLMQISGRAGRSDLASKVIIQTFSPDSFAIRAIKESDYEGFYKRELGVRREMNYPPFTEIVNIIFSSKCETSVIDAAKIFSDNLNVAKKDGLKFELLGPVPAPISKIGGMHRWHSMVKTSELEMVLPRLKGDYIRLNSQAAFVDVKITVDVDSVWML
ncbi:MAG: primosomal protein N' [Actinomycetota bacterium]|nr:primosomal protein N' [Actinomycetota bacterium]